MKHRDEIEYMDKQDAVCAIELYPDRARCCGDDKRKDSKTFDPALAVWALCEANCG